MSLQDHYAVVRQRLRYPANSVRDEGIDLKRKAVAAEPPAPPAELPIDTRVAVVMDPSFIPEFLAPRQPSLLFQRTTIATNDIIRHVAWNFRVTVGDIKSARRTANVVLPRHVAMYLTRSMTPRSLPEIGLSFGDKDHTTVLNAVERIRKKRAMDPEFDVQVSRIRLEIEDKFRPES